MDLDREAEARVVAISLAPCRQPGLAFEGVGIQLVPVMSPPRHPMRPSFPQSFQRDPGISSRIRSFKQVPAPSGALCSFLCPNRASRQHITCPPSLRVGLRVQELCGPSSMPVSHLHAFPPGLTQGSHQLRIGPAIAAPLFLKGQGQGLSLAVGFGPCLWPFQFPTVGSAMAPQTQRPILTLGLSTRPFLTLQGRPLPQAQVPPQSWRQRDVRGLPGSRAGFHWLPLKTKA